MNDPGQRRGGAGRLRPSAHDAVLPPISNRRDQGEPNADQSPRLGHWQVLDEVPPRRDWTAGFYLSKTA